VQLHVLGKGNWRAENATRAPYQGCWDVPALGLYSWVKSGRMGPVVRGDSTGATFR
jgi:hypothetical protein